MSYDTYVRYRLSLGFITCSFFMGIFASNAQVKVDGREPDEIFRHALNNFRYDSIRMYKSMDSLKAQEDVSPVYAQLLKSRYLAHNGHKNKGMANVDSLLEHHRFRQDSLRAFTSLYKAKLLLNNDNQKALETALNIKRKINRMTISDNFKANLYLVLGTGFNLSQNYEQGIKHYEQAELFFKKAGNKEDLAVVYNNLGNTFRRLDPKDTTVVRYYDKAINVLKNTSHEHISNIIKLNLNTVKAGLGKEVALEDVQRLEEYFIKNGDKLRLANTYKLKALYYTPADIEKAKKAYKRSLNSIADENIHKVDIYINYIELLNDNGAAGEAEQQLRQLKLILDGFDHQTKRYHLKDYYSQQARKDSITSNYLSAIRNYQLAKEYEDSINEENYDEVVASERIKYETKQKELQLKKKNNQILDLQVEQENQEKWISTFISLAILLFITAVLILYFNRRINLKNRELADSLAHNELLFKELQHRTKNNLELLSGLIDFAFRNNTDTGTIKHVIEKRVVMLSRVYEQLNASSNIEHVNAQVFIRELVHKIISAQYLNHENKLRINVSGLNFNISNKFAIELGLLINEFTLNAIKYAFLEEKDYEMNISAEWKNNLLDAMTLAHDGKPPQNKNVNFKYLELIADQLRADLSTSYAKEGFAISLKFKDEQPWN